MNLTHASSVLLRWLGAVSTFLLPGIATGQTPSVAAPPDSLSLAAVYVRLHAGTPRIMAARAAAQAAAERVGPARRPPDPELQFALMNREIPGFGLSDPLGMNQIQLTQMIPIAGKVGLAADVERALTAVRHATEAKDNVLPALIEAARARVTVGETMTAMAEVLGRCDTAVV